MKTIFTFITLFFFGMVCEAQVIEQGINYKALLKDNSGNIIADTFVVVLFTIYEGDALTNDVFVEQHGYTTDENGFIILNIGTGNTVDNFNAINWGDDEHFLNVQVDVDGAGLTDLGTTQFMSVPYAEQSKRALNVTKLPEPYILGRSVQSSNGRFQFNGKYGWQAAQEMCEFSYPNDPNVRAFTLEQIGQAIVLGNWDANNLNNVEDFNFWAITPYAVGSSHGSYAAHAQNSYGLNGQAGDISNGTRGQIKIDAPTENGSDQNPLNTYLMVQTNVVNTQILPCMCGTYIN